MDFEPVPKPKRARLIAKKQTGGSKRDRETSSEFVQSSPSSHVFPIVYVGLLDGNFVGSRTALLSVAHYRFPDAAGLGSPHRLATNTSAAKPVPSGSDTLAIGHASSEPSISSHTGPRVSRTRAWRTLMKALQVQGLGSLSMAANVAMNEWSLDTLGTKNPYWNAFSSKGPQVNIELLCQELEKTNLF